MKYQESLKDSFNLDEIIIGVVKQISSRKKAENKNPAIALEKDIWSELVRLMANSLHDLYKRRKFLKVETINMNGYKIVE